MIFPLTLLMVRRSLLRMNAFLLVATLIAGGALGAGAAEIGWVPASTAEKVKQAAVTIILQGPNSMNGFFASEDGLVMTLAGPLEGASRVTITTSRGDTINNARLVALDLGMDLAVFATGKKAPAWLPLENKRPDAGSFGVMAYGPQCKIADANLLGYRPALGMDGAHLHPRWSVGLNPTLQGIAGAAVVTADEKVVGLCESQHHIGKEQTITEAITAGEMAELLKRGKAGREAVAFPRAGDINPALTRDPDLIEGHKRLTSGDMMGATLKYEESLRKHPESSLTMGHLAYCLSRAGDTARALALMENATRLDPKNYSLRSSLGEMISEAGDEPKAAQYFQALTQEFPEFGMAWFYLGDKLQKTGRDKEAAQALKKAVELEPDMVLAWSKYAAALSATGSFDEANAARDRAAKLESVLFKLRYSTPQRN